MFYTNQLIVIGGPSCAGKTFLLNRIQQADFPHLRKQLGLDNPSSWLYVGAMNLPYIDQPIVERLVVHYDFYTHYSQENEFKYLRELMSNSHTKTILTLSVSPELLRRRVTVRIIKRFFPLLFNRKFKRLGQLLNQEKTYLDSSNVLDLYEKWFDFFEQCSGVNHWLLDSSKSNITVANLR
ncbi:MAG: hypothetical protein QNJ55_30250 [Xenococcus sp. MO_188.B8]|nr:hypothetical protein [Xenococcus sp. MO_188.B8]